MAELDGVVEEPGVDAASIVSEPAVPFPVPVVLDADVSPAPTDVALEEPLMSGSVLVIPNGIVWFHLITTAFCCWTCEVWFVCTCWLLLLLLVWFTKLP